MPDLPAMALNKFASAMPTIGLGKKENSILPKTHDNSLALDKVDEAEEKSDQDDSKDKKVMFAETKVVNKKPS